jgi:hypothetical protein
VNQPDDPAAQDSDEEKEPDLDLEIDVLPGQPDALIPSSVNPGDEVVITNLHGLGHSGPGDTDFAFAERVTLGQKVTVRKKGKESCYVELDRGLRIWFGYNRLTLPRTGTDLDADVPMVAEEEQQTSCLAHVCEPLPPRMKDDEVIANTKEERFIRIQLETPRSTPWHHRNA